MRLLKTLRSLVLSAGWGALVYMATVELHPGAGNLVGFMCAGLAGIGTVMLFAPKPASPVELSLPKWLGISIDLVVVGMLAWHAWFICAFAYAWALLCAEAYQSKASREASP